MTCRTLRTQDQDPQNLYMKDTEDKTFEVYIFWDLGILVGPSGLKKGPTARTLQTQDQGPHISGF